MSMNYRGVGSETGGVILMLLGVAGFFLDFESTMRLVIFVLIYFGVRDLVTPYNGRPPSIFVLVIGVWMAISAYPLVSLDWTTSWPLLIVLVGLSLIFDGVVESAEPAMPQAEGK